MNKYNFATDVTKHSFSSSSRLGQRGQSLLETIVVLSLTTIVIGALTFTTITSLRNAQFAKNLSQVTKLAQEGIEKTRSLRDRNGVVELTKSDSTKTSSFVELYDLSLSCEISNPNCYFNLNSDSELIEANAATFEEIDGVFKRQIIIEDGIDGDIEKKVTSIVKWSDFAGEHESKLTTILRKL